ncbi:type IV pilin protein [Neisseria shayeganii]|uniref:Prepilin-type N-terminal cleavage/methylation domain-containing protein n=1 Tax=Neisseria shayeganii TaxID=607712 RepID=A0A7D7S711_9NEIS|nr:prepilin-type N-terminal cleavage/methylation domain-containing protein [Neisseria shayeganii]QMT39551.1 prepilin-type N-terminal cleavage/methylation domain-containing protein [Neisseria shayeganii]
MKDNIFKTRKNIAVGFTIAAGFTLVEMMIVVAIIGILAAIAVPSYSHYVERTNLATAKNELVELVAEMRQRKVKNLPTYSVTGLNSLVNGKRTVADGNYQLQAVVTGGDINTFYIYLKPNRSGFTKSLYITAAGQVFECPSMAAASNKSGCTRINS